METCQSYMDNLFTQNPVENYDALVELKNNVIGSNKQKNHAILMGIVPRLIQYLLDDDTDVHMLTEATVVLGSLAKGTLDHVAALIDHGIVQITLKGLGHTNQPFVEACLRCLRTILMTPIAPVDLIYQDPNVVPQLIHLLPLSATTQECVANILAHCCKTMEHQTILCNNDAIAALSPLIQTNVFKVQMPALKCFAVLCYQNPSVSTLVANGSFNGKMIIDSIAELLSRDKPLEMQMAAAKCFTFMCRADAISPQDVIVFRTLPCLVRMCKKDKDPSVRIEGAEVLAYLTEMDSDLQRTASISDHLISTLSQYFKYIKYPDTTEQRKMEENEKIHKEMVQAAFLAFASISANDEDVRKKIIETEGVMELVVNGLSDANPKVALASVRCLHSLSRSVQQLRTSFQDHGVWKPLMKLLYNGSEDIMIGASSTLCNLLLEFSPSKEPMLEHGAVDLLCGLTRNDNSALRLNGIWALMNMAFQAEQSVKSSILKGLGTDQLFRLLSDTDVNILMKTLGLLRNLLTTKPHIDYIMGVHGKQVMQAVILILEGDHIADVKEQALCILANIADGESAKEYIMSNEDVLKKIVSYMVHPNIKLQIAATFCVSNLIWNEEDGSWQIHREFDTRAYERQIRLREMGVRNLLQQLQDTSDTVLYDKVKTALNQFGTS